MYLVSVQVLRNEELEFDASALSVYYRLAVVALAVREAWGTFAWDDDRLVVVIRLVVEVCRMVYHSTAVHRGAVGDKVHGNLADKRTWL